MNVLEIKGLDKRFGDKQVLRGLDLCVPERCVFGFVGRNGAGKTTTMKAVLGLLRPDGGEICVSGERVVYGQTVTNRHVGYLPDVPEFYSFMTAREYLALCADCLGIERAEARRRGEELLALVGLDGEKHRIKGYSRGMKQRLGIAQALIGRPRLLICDEPTSALDPVGRRDILDILLSVREQTTVLFSTHILSDVERICTDVAFLSDGHVTMQGTVAEVKALKRSEELTVELEDPDDTARLLGAFPDAVRLKSDTLLFGGEESRSFAVLAFIADNRINVRRIERAEPSLESLFMEVTSK